MLTINFLHGALTFAHDGYAMPILVKNTYNKLGDIWDE